jgi:hypothetical protein
MTVCPTRTSGLWKNSGSVSDKLGLTGIKQKSCFSNDSARLQPQEAIKGTGSRVSLHPTYRLDLVPSDFHLFGAPVDAIQGKKKFTMMTI